MRVIPTTGVNAMPYTPLPMDPSRYEREQQPQILALENSVAKLEEDAATLEDEERTKALIEIGALRAELKATREAVALEVKQLRAKYPRPVTFMLSVPTSMERDGINARLIMLGISPVTQEIMRATMIEELFAIDWGKGSLEANEAYAEETANFLDGCWQRQEVHDTAIARWQEREEQRILDEAAGAPPRPREELPPKLITVRENARLTLLIPEMFKRSVKMRELAARQNDFDRFNSHALVRAHVISASGEGWDVPLERDERANALTEASAAALREALPDDCWFDLVSHINSMYVLPEEEVKNSDWPAGSPSGQSGSPAPIDGLVNSGGSSTTLNTGPALAVVSEKTIEPSSTTTSDFTSAPANERENAFPTGGA